MRERLAVSDAGLNILAMLALPDLTVIAQARMPFRPGKLYQGDYLYCADAEGPAVHVVEPESLAHIASFATGPEIEALSLSGNNMYLYVLSGGADSLQMLLAGQGRLCNVVRVGMRPRGIAQGENGGVLAVAGGDTGDILLIDSATLRIIRSLPAGGATAGVCFFAGQVMALCSAGEYDMGTLVGSFGEDGKWTPWVALPGMPGSVAPCGGGLLVGHHMHLTMLDAPNGRIRWQTKIAGLPTEIVPVGRAACFIDALDGMVGLIDLRRGTLLRRLLVQEPTGLAALS